MERPLGILLIQIATTVPSHLLHPSPAEAGLLPHRAQPPWPQESTGKPSPGRARQPSGAALSHNTVVTHQQRLSHYPQSLLYRERKEPVTLV
ncbi:hypothetical protein BaRGS_00006450 [Batillaria attramentaria]|uniref:Uncharacterized protein n=1 Tax=Batillaria attramentaria TaxID=370345 RepID=A0ABD0LU70_9CAEN